MFQKNVTIKKRAINSSTTICSLVSEIASKYPNRIAVEDEKNNCLTYKVCSNIDVS